MVGSAATAGHLSDATYTGVIGTQYNLVTAENACKWGSTEPQRGQFAFSQCDTVSNFAKKYNQTFRGHNLCWGQSNPSWLEGLSPADKRAALKTHITTVINHYGDSAYCWDVVNEAVADSGTTLLKNTVWYPDLPDYVDFAFTTARAANPNVKLFYNDYNIASSTGWSADKSNNVYNMIKSMKDRGIPIDGVGFQLHVDINYNLFDGIKQNLQRFASLGLEIHMTEIDVSCGSGCNWTPDKEQQQASVYGSLISTCIAQPKCTNFETWGFTDKYTWLGTNVHPLPFDENYHPKQAFNTLLTTIKSG